MTAQQPEALRLMGPLTDEQTKALMQAHRTAMLMACKARVPECGEFSAIAQDLDWLCESLGIKGSRPAQADSSVARKCAGCGATDCDCDAHDCRMGD